MSLPIDKLHAQKLGQMSLSSCVGTAIRDMRSMSEYVPNLSTYNLCQWLHPGRRELQIEAAKYLQNASLILDGGPSDGLFSTYFLTTRLPKAQIVCVDIDPEAVRQHRRNFDGNSRVTTLDAMPLDVFASSKLNGYTNKFDAAYFGGMWTDTGEAAEERIPTLRNLHNNVLTSNGMVLFDEETTTKHNPNNFDERVAALWKHHGNIILASLLNHTYHHNRADNDYEQNTRFPTIEEIQKAINNDDNNNHALSAAIYLQLAIQEELFAFASGVLNYGDHKQQTKVFRDEEIIGGGFRHVECKRIWPKDSDLIVHQNTNSIISGLRKGIYPSTQQVWDHYSAKAIGEILKVERKTDGSTHLVNDEHFKKASQYIKECAKVLRSFPNPYTEPRSLSSIGINLEPAGDVDFGVHLFVGKKVLL